MTRRRSSLVQIQTKAEPTDPFSEEHPVWSNAFDDEPTTYAQVHPMRGDELFQAQQKFQDVTHKVTIDYRSGINSRMRLKWGTRILHISGIINPREANRSLELMCREVV